MILALAIFGGIAAYVCGIYGTAWVVPRTHALKENDDFSLFVTSVFWPIGISLLLFFTAMALVWFIVAHAAGRPYK